MQILAFWPIALPWTVYKTLEKNGVLVRHAESDMHHGAVLQADLFRLNFENPSARVDSRIMLKEVDQQEENKTVLRKIATAVDFLAKQGLPLRGHRDDKVDFSNKDVNQGENIATLRLLSQKSLSFKDNFFRARKMLGIPARLVRMKS